MRSLLSAVLVGLVGSSGAARAQVDCQIEERDSAGRREAYSCELAIAPSLAEAPQTELRLPARLFPTLTLDLFAYRDPAGRALLSANVVDTLSYAVQGATGEDGEVTMVLLERERIIQAGCYIRKTP
jgi:hypothetical protein